MGDETTTLSDADARHLLRRTGFGAKPADWQSFTGMTRGDAAGELLAFKPKGFKPSGPDIGRAQSKWVKYMLKTRQPLQEKLVLFWHDHFATGFSKVQNVPAMAQQNKTIRLNCKGDMRAFVKAMNKDAAMIEWLDTVRNDKDQPNENYARELQELFTLGVKDLKGVDNYTQADIVQIARAFTGWSYDSRNLAVSFDGGDHDTIAEFPSRGGGTKDIYGTARPNPPGPAGNYGGFSIPQSFANPEGITEIDQVIDIIFAHTDSDGKNTVARRTTKRLLEYFCHGAWASPDAGMIATIDQLVATSSFDATFIISDLLRAIFTNDVFYAAGVDAPFTTATPKSVIWPIDYVVSTLRMTGVKLHGSDQQLQGGSFQDVTDHLSSMGQDLLDPPSVFGWDWESAWISSATLLARYQFASDVTTARSGGGRFRPEKLIDLSISAAPAIVDAVTDALSVTTLLTSTERNALITYLGGPSATLDLTDFDTRNEKLHGLFALVLQSPVFQVH
jgi:uncharacterized protein (DUF1800 family)